MRVQSEIIEKPFVRFFFILYIQNFNTRVKRRLNEEYTRKRDNVVNL